MGKPGNNQISRLGKFVVVVAIIWFVGSTVFHSHRTNLTQFLTFPLVPLFLIAIIVSVVCIFIDWRVHRWMSFFPAGACILAILLSHILTNWIRHTIFIRCLPSYQRIVRQIESGEISVSTNLTEIPQAVATARMTYSVAAYKDSNGLLTVEFLTETGFPVAHSGYLYCSSGAIQPGTIEDSRWPFRYEERPRWFSISDK